MIVSIDANGTARQLEGADSISLVPDGILARASHVEPANLALRIVFHVLRMVCGESGLVGNYTRTWSCNWRVNLSPVSGPILPTIYAMRQDAIDAEIAWLETNWL